MGADLAAATFRGAVKQGEPRLVSSVGIATELQLKARALFQQEPNGLGPGRAPRVFGRPGV